jgi:hypothetical protein
MQWIRRQRTDVGSDYGRRVTEAFKVNDFLIKLRKSTLDGASQEKMLQCTKNA